jgi:hypothetical protein
MLYDSIRFWFGIAERNLRLLPARTALVAVTVMLAITSVRAQNFDNSGQVSHNTWTLGTPVPTAREGMAIGVVGREIFVVGGANNSGPLNVNEAYNTVTQKWVTRAPMLTPRFVPASAVVNDILYVMGGCGSGCGTLSSAEAYDPKTDTWSPIASMPAPVDSVYAVVVGGIIYVVGGDVNGERLATVYAYNPATNTWSDEAPLKEAKSQAALGVFGGTIIAAGGLTSSGGATTDNEAYFTKENDWKTAAPMVTGRHAGCFGTIDGNFYFAGGTEQGSGSPLTVMEAFASSDSWTTGLAAMPDAVINAGSATVDGVLYCFGGSNDGGPVGGSIYDYVQVYQP